MCKICTDSRNLPVSSLEVAPTLAPYPNQYRLQTSYVIGPQVGAGAGIGYNPDDKNVGLEFLTPVGQFAANLGCLNRICIIACLSIKVC